MAFSQLTFEDFLQYPGTDGFERSDYFCWGFDGLKLPKHALELHDRGLKGISARDFYDSIFGDALEPQREPGDYIQGEYGGIMLELSRDGKGYPRRRTFTQGQPELYEMIDTSKRNVFTAPVSYAGRKRTNENARYLFAMTIEIDEIVDRTGLDELFHQWEMPEFTKLGKSWKLPKPTYIVCSGSGLHLYFVFAEPIPLYRNIFEQLQKAKSNLTRKFWSRYITNLYDKIQFEPINQAFRVPGSQGKEDGVRALAFVVGNGDKISIDDLNKSLPQDLHITFDDTKRTPLEQAKELWPDWYERRIVQGKPKKTGTSTYQKHRAVYDAWKERIMTGATVGRRYYCLEHLCALAVQCDIDEEELDRDIAEIAELFERLTISDDNHFTDADIRAAKKTYTEKSMTAYTRRLEYITERTGIPLPRNKRNGRTRDEHLKRARALLAVDYEELQKQGKFENVGRPSKAEQVKQWRADNPTGKMIDCHRETGISRPTIQKHWE